MQLIVIIFKFQIKRFKMSDSETINLDEITDESFLQSLVMQLLN